MSGQAKYVGATADVVDALVACHECGGTGDGRSPTDGRCKVCGSTGLVRFSQFDGRPRHVYGLSEQLAAEGWCFPVTETVTRAWSERLIREDDSNDTLIIRMELPYLDHAALMDLLQDGIDARLERIKVLERYAETASADPKSVAPLHLRDIEYATNRARDMARMGKALMETVRRPKPGERKP